MIDLDLDLLIRARFYEAADTERRLPFAKVKPQAYGSSWPTFHHEFADLVGWGEERLAEERRMVPRKLPPSAAAISRHDECLEWTSWISPKAGTPEGHRRALWAVSFCEVSGKPFAAWCRKENIARMTGYRRYTRSIEIISAILRKNSMNAASPDEQWVLHICDSGGIKSARSESRTQRAGIETTGDDDGRSQAYWRSGDVDPMGSEDPRWALVAEKQAARRAEAERRRREKLSAGD